MSQQRCTLLIVDDEASILTALTALLGKDFDVLTAESAESAQGLFTSRPIDLVLADQRLPGMAGVQLLEWVREHSPRTVRLLMTGLARFEDAVDAINCGQVYRYLFKPWRSEELRQILLNAAHTHQLERSHERLLEELRQLNLELEERVRCRTRELEEANFQLQQKTLMLEKLALTDPLTGLPNRRAMDGLARSELRRRERYPGPLALGIIDADHFKAINDRYLLTGGDHVLVGLAKTLQGSLRTVDTVGRIGGEEFMLVAPETNREGAAILGERIRAAVENSRYTYQGQAIGITVSVGLAVTETGAPADYDQIKYVAADALKDAKGGGRNRCVVRVVGKPREGGD